MPHKRRLFLGLILGAVGCVIPNEVNAWPPHEEPLFGNANGSHPKNSLYLPLISGLDVVAIFLAEQVKAPEDRQRTLNCLGLLVSNALAKTSHLENTGLLRLSLRFLGSNLGEIRDLFRAVKNRNAGEYLRSRSKREIAAFVLKCLLVTAPTTKSLSRKMINYFFPPEPKNVKVYKDLGFEIIRTKQTFAPPATWSEVLDPPDPNDDTGGPSKPPPITLLTFSTPSILKSTDKKREDFFRLTGLDLKNPSARRRALKELSYSPEITVDTTRGVVCYEKDVNEQGLFRPI